MCIPHQWQSIREGEPDVLRVLAWGGWPRSSLLKWHNAKRLQSSRIQNLLACWGIKGWERLKDASSLSICQAEHSELCYRVTADSSFIKLNLVLLRRILINYLVMKNVRGTTFLHQGLMITLIDAVARFSWQGRNEKHDTWTFKGDLRGFSMLLNDTKIEQENRGSEGLNVSSQTDGLHWATDHWGWCRDRSPALGRTRNLAQAALGKHQVLRILRIKRRGKVEGK